MASQIDAYLRGEIPKIKTHFAEIIVCGQTEKPYYNIVFIDPQTREYEVCFGSYLLENVRKWLSEEFEIVDAPTVDAVEVVHGRWEDIYGGKYENPRFRCSLCKQKALYTVSLSMLGNWLDVQDLSHYCHNCGAQMDLEVKDG